MMPSAPMLWRPRVLTAASSRRSEGNDVHTTGELRRRIGQLASSAGDQGRLLRAVRARRRLRFESSSTSSKNELQTSVPRDSMPVLPMSGAGCSTSTQPCGSTS